MSTSPDSKERRPAIHFIRVDFPVPFGPIRQKIYPSDKWRDTLEKTGSGSLWL
jgi:hypothetical protein